MKRTLHPLARLLARMLGACLIVGTLCGGLVVSCAGDPPSSTPNTGNQPSSQSMGRWTPVSGQDTCPKSLHDTFFVLGPDGKKYPTWHPAETTDPATNAICSFGHEHGPDPSGSAMWSTIKTHFAYDANNNNVVDASELAVSGIPFGYVSEQLITSTTPRLEDHTAYKVAYTDLVRRTTPAPRTGDPASVDCHLFAAYNQPTSTADAFASNMYSVTYAVDCTVGAAASQYPVKAVVSVMARYRTPGQFTLDDSGTQVVVNQAAVPPTSADGGTGSLGRRIPTNESVFPAAFVTATGTSSFTGLFELWEAQVRLRRADQTVLALFEPQFRVDDPARYFYRPTTVLAHSIDLCYWGLTAQDALVTDPTLSATIVRKVRNASLCDIAPNGPATPTAQRLAYTDKTSPFKGCKRLANFGAETVTNPGGPATWYTDAFGDNASTTRSANTVKQMLQPGDTNGIVLAGLNFGQQSACPAASVHAPN